MSAALSEQAETRGENKTQKAEERTADLSDAHKKGLIQIDLASA